MELFALTILLSLATLISAFDGHAPDQIPLSVTYIRPTVYSEWDGIKGAIDFNVTACRIVKNLKTNKSTSTLLTFEFPSSSRGKKCQFGFALARENRAAVCPPDQAPPPGAQCTGNFQLWSSVQPAKPGAPGNQRDRPLGTLSASVGKEATWVSGNPYVMDCPSGTWAGELVGVGDYDYIAWTVWSSLGPYWKYV